MMTTPVPGPPFTQSGVPSVPLSVCAQCRPLLGRSLLIAVVRWQRLWDYWNYEHVQYFDSFEHLVRLFNETDLHAISANMQRWIARKADEVRVQIVSGLAHVAGLLAEPRITPSPYEYESEYRAMWGSDPPSAELVVEDLYGGFIKRLWTCPLLHRAFSLKVVQPAVLRLMLTNATGPGDATTISTICTWLALDSDDGCTDERISAAQRRIEAFFSQPWVLLALERNASAAFAVDFEMPHADAGSKHVCVEYDWETDLQLLADATCKRVMSELTRNGSVDAFLLDSSCQSETEEVCTEESSACRKIVLERLTEFRHSGGPYRISYPDFYAHS